MNRIFALLLCFVLLAGMLTGCAPAHAPEAYEPTGDALTTDEEETPIYNAGDQEQSLSLAFYADQSLNPLEATDFTNKVLINLMYQGLFSVNRNNEVIPILCKNYTASTDLMTYEFTIDPMATFSDGARVMPEDVERTAQVFDLLLGDNLQGRKDHIAENGYKYLDMADIS